MEMLAAASYEVILRAYRAMTIRYLDTCSLVRMHMHIRQNAGLFLILLQALCGGNRLGKCEKPSWFSSFT